jgi:hypothetical protein
MSLNPRHFAPVLVAAGTAAIAVAPIAAADPVGPVPGNQSAADTLSELQAQGLRAPDQLGHRFPNGPLSECWVDAIHNPDGLPSSLNILAIVHVDVGCPEHQS